MDTQSAETAIVTQYLKYIPQNDIHNKDLNPILSNSYIACYSMSFHIILYYTILYYTILYYTILYYTILYYTILYYTILYYTILYCTVLYCTKLYYTVLYCTILYYTILYHTILYSTKRTPNLWQQPSGRRAPLDGTEATSAVAWAGPNGWWPFKRKEWGSFKGVIRAPFMILSF